MSVRTFAALSPLEEGSKSDLAALFSELSKPAPGGHSSSQQRYYSLLYGNPADSATEPGSTPSNHPIEAIVH